MHTPNTPEGARIYDRLPAADAVMLAWQNPGPNPDWHRKCQEQVRATMPLLARALDRLASVQEST